jgi:hypothetical protein
MRTFLRVPAVAAAAGLFLAPAAGSASAAVTVAAAPPGPAAMAGIISGVTTMTTDPGLPSLLFRKDITMLATTPATETLTGGSRLFGGLPTGPGHSTVRIPALRFSFPVAGGRAGLHPVSGRVSQRGGVLFVQAGSARTVLLSSFVVDFGDRHVTAEVDGDPRVRVAVFQLDLSHARVSPAGHAIRVTGIGLTVTGAGARAVDSGLGTTVLSPGTQVGSAATVLRTGALAG